MIAEETKNSTQSDAGSADQESGQQPVASHQELENCHLQLRDLHEKYIRLSADFKNFQDRVARERAETLRQAKIDVIGSLLPIVDNFKRAMADMPSIADTQCAAWAAGLELINKQIASLLAQYGVTEIDCSGTFDPAMHEAIAHIAGPEHGPEHIIQVVRAGYTMAGTVLRPAQVIVGQK